MNCQYQYAIQPGPTSEICPLEGHSETALILKCQVLSENGSDFSIVWHHRQSVPDSSNIFDHETNVTNSSFTIINTTNTTVATQASLTSQLTLHGFDDKTTGYYWCSVQVSSSSNMQIQNPSVILHIVHNTHCKANNELPCTGDISLYSNTSMASSLRCADHATSVETIEAQRCPNPTTQVDENQIGKSNPPDLPTQTSSQQGNFPITTSLHVSNTQPTLQENIPPSVPKFQLSMGVIIGASMGGLVLVLFIVIGLLLASVVKKRRHRTREHVLEVTSPFDDIRMYSTIAKLTHEKVDDPNRISKLYCESNTAYECPQTEASLQTENFYEFIR
jgi:hypothetical protein